MIELLIVQDGGEYWKVIGTQPMDKPVVDSNTSLLKASFKALEDVKIAIKEGKQVLISKNISGSEVIPSDLLVDTSINEIQRAKNVAIVQITNLINQNVFGMSVIDAMDYLDCMLKLMSVGIFINDENREDKYFEIIEAAQTIEEPKPLSETSTFEEEQNYIEQKRKYDQAQKNLSTLEKYLNAYDKLSKIRFINDLLNTTKENVEQSQTIDDIQKSMQEYKEKLDKFIFEK